MTTDFPDFKNMPRSEVLSWVENAVSSGEVSLGGAIRVLRRHVAKQNQADFAGLCGLSEALSTRRREIPGLGELPLDLGGASLKIS